MDALKKARALLKARASDPRVRFIPGLADDLAAIASAFDEIDARTTVLAAVVLQKHYWPDSALSTAHMDALAVFGVDEAVTLRRETHGEGCLCRECMPSHASIR